MKHILTFLLFIALARSEPEHTKHSYNSTNCDGFQAAYNVGNVWGPWHVVAIIPDKLFPDRDVNCYKVDFRESDPASVRWMVNMTKSINKPKLEDIKGSMIRQRYETEQPFNVWSMAVEGVNGCFKQVLSADEGHLMLETTATHDAMMQLHLIITKTNLFLVQLLWGRNISTVIFNRRQGITQEQLKPVYEEVSQLRGPQRLPRICNSPLKDYLLNYY